MSKLISMELRRNNLGMYVKSAFIITIVSLLLLYTFAILSRSEEEFSSYTDILAITGVVNMACFSIMGAVMFSKFVISEYAGKRSLLLFSYPIDRKKVLWAKVVIVELTTVIGLIVSNLGLFAIFYVTESVFPLVRDTLTFRVILFSLLLSIIQGLVAGSFALISMAVGFVKKSVPATIITAVLLCALISNFFATMSSFLSLIGFLAIGTNIAAFVMLGGVAKKIETLEV